MATGPIPGAAWPTAYGSQQTIQTGDVQNAPGGAIECASGKILAFYTRSVSHVGSGSITMRTATNEAAANAGTFSSATTIVQESYPYYYGFGGVSRIDAGAHAGRVWVVFARANLPSGTHISTQLIYSDDEGATWSVPQTVPDQWTDWLGAACASPIVQLPSGALALALYGRDTGQNSAWCKLLKSYDDGVTWVFASNIIPYQVDNDQAEPALAMVWRADGSYRLVCVANALNQSLAYSTGTIRITYSDDEGGTWAAAADCGLGAGWGGAPGLLQGPDGAVYLLLRNVGTDVYKTYYSRSTNYGAAGSFTSAVLVYGTGAMRYGEFFNLASGRLALCFGTETSTENAGIYWKVYEVGPFTPGVPDPGEHLTLDADADWTQTGTTIAVTGAAVGVVTSVTAEAYSADGGTIRFAGAHASRFEVSDDGSTWGATLVIAAGTTPIWIRATPQAGDTSLAARIGIPA